MELLILLNICEKEGSIPKIIRGDVIKDMANERQSENRRVIPKNRHHSCLTSCTLLFKEGQTDSSSRTI